MYSDIGQVSELKFIAPPYWRMDRTRPINKRGKVWRKFHIDKQKNSLGRKRKRKREGLREREGEGESLIEKEKEEKVRKKKRQQEKKCWPEL